MFEGLTNKLQAVFDKLSKRGVLSEADVDAALREVRLALLEADVHYTVVKDFLDACGSARWAPRSANICLPHNRSLKIVYEELITTLGKPAPLDLSGQPPHVMMLVGLQGSGKTTMAAKLGLRLKGSAATAVVAADTYRPAAVTQLQVLGKQLDLPVHSEGTQVPPPQICRNAFQPRGKRLMAR